MAQLGGGVAKWSKVLLREDKINENQNVPRSPPSQG